MYPDRGEARQRGAAKRIDGKCDRAASSSHLVDWQQLLDPALARE